MANSKWNSSNMANQDNKIVVITGATSGLGKEAARVFAQKNATVIMAVRNTQKGEEVATEIKKALPDAKIEVRKLDLGSLSAIKSFSEGINDSYSHLDILINNAGVMTCPFSKTEDGFEIQMGTNHLGHFALTGLLMPLLKNTKGARIVATSSIAHRQGNIDFEDINWEKRTYSKMKAYGDSKLANLYFAYELARRLKDDANAPIVTAAHPGWTGTELQRHNFIFRILNPIFSQNVANGVLPTLRAATDENAKSGDYFGPSGFQEIKGSPIVVKSNKMSYNEANAKRLWDLSEKMTGIKF
jgi:NAD(P)-dependent dehydrogenase (short-subunit alcohol dehydrogenase family)